MANLQSAYGLDQPVWAQYVRYMRGVAHGDFGPSFRYKDFTVTELIAQGFPVTFELGTIAFALALAMLGFPSGHSRRFTATPRRTTRPCRSRSRESRFPRSCCCRCSHCSSASICTGSRLQVGNRLSPASCAAGTRLSLPPLAYIARLTRGGMLEVLGSPFIRTALAKGLPLRSVIVRHALRPALVPVAGYLAPAVASIMTGSLVVESIAGLPGVGRYLVQGALNRDYTLVLGMVILYSALLIGMGLLVDLLYAWLDPRVRFER